MSFGHVRLELLDARPVRARSDAHDVALVVARKPGTLETGALSRRHDHLDHAALCLPRAGALARPDHRVAHLPRRSNGHHVLLFFSPSAGAVRAINWSRQK